VFNQTFDELKLEKHPDKTVIGRIERGFDFLGYHFSPDGISVARKTVENFISRATRLYEQELREPNDSSRLGEYVKRWIRVGRPRVSLRVMWLVTMVLPSSCPSVCGS